MDVAARTANCGADHVQLYDAAVYRDTEDAGTTGHVIYF